jgi:hypothetical protein
MLTLCLLAVRAEGKVASVKLEPEAALGAYMGLVEDHLAGILRIEKTIAISKEAKSAKWDEVKPLLDRFSQDLPTNATVWFMMPDGSYYATAKGGLTDQNLKDRTYFPKRRDALHDAFALHDVRWHHRPVRNRSGCRGGGSELQGQRRISARARRGSYASG